MQLVEPQELKVVFVVEIDRDWRKAQALAFGHLYPEAVPFEFRLSDLPTDLREWLIRKVDLLIAGDIPVPLTSEALALATCCGREPVEDPTIIFNELLEIFPDWCRFGVPGVPTTDRIPELWRAFLNKVDRQREVFERIYDKHKCEWNSTRAQKRKAPRNLQ